VERSLALAVKRSLTLAVERSLTLAVKRSLTLAVKRSLMLAAERSLRSLCGGEEARLVAPVIPSPTFLALRGGSAPSMSIL